MDETIVWFSLSVAHACMGETNSSTRLEPYQILLPMLKKPRFIQFVLITYHTRFKISSVE